MQCGFYKYVTVNQKADVAEYNINNCLVLSAATAKLAIDILALKIKVECFQKMKC